jgi:DNA-binding CsgD family transcriptional regulator/PAS domain-containing protein
LDKLRHLNQDRMTHASAGWTRLRKPEREVETPQVPLNPPAHTALQAALAVLLSPLDAVDANAWRGDVSQTLTELLGADKASFELEMPNISQMYSEDYSQETLDAYMRYYREIDIGRIQRETLGLEVWNRQLLHGRHLPEFYKSEIHTDFLVPNGIRDSMGITVEVPGLATPATLFFHKERTGTTQFGVRGLAFLGLLLPAFKAGVRDLVRYSHQRVSLSSHLDSLIEGIRIVDLEGRVIHQNPSFTTIVTGKPIEAKAEQAITDIVSELSTLTRDRHGNIMALAGAQVRREILSDASSYELRGSFLGRELLGAEVRVAISLQKIAWPTGLSDEALQRRFGLSEREIQVARCLARGESTKEIAQSCGMSPHTARRHTEKIFVKLGVRNRSQIGPKLRGE